MKYDEYCRRGGNSVFFCKRGEIWVFLSKGISVDFEKGMGFGKFLQKG